MGMTCAVALVLMLDSSGSVSAGRFSFQRDATAAALEDPSVVAAVQRGGLAVTVVVFSHVSRVVVGWNVLRDARDAHRFGDMLRAVPHSYGPSTLTGSALAFSLDHLASAPCGDRQVVDVSTDGPGDDTGRLHEARVLAQDRGVQVNGLLVTPDYPGSIPRDWALSEVEDGLAWMQSELVTQDGFAMQADGASAYPSIIRRKMVTEISSR